MDEQGNRVRMTATDFMTGIIAAMTICHWRTIYLDGGRFEANVAKVFERLHENADELGIDLRFQIRPHYIHGNSPTVLTELFRATQCGMLSIVISDDDYGGAYFRIFLDHDEAHHILEKIPSGRVFFIPAVKELILDW